MYSNHAHYGYRRLTENEAEKATRAIKWLLARHLNPQAIVMLTDRTLDREAKVLYAKIETKHVVWYRKIRYAGSDLDLYLTEVLPCLKVRKWLFPNLCWTGRNPSYGSHVKAETVEKYMRNQSKKVLIRANRDGKIELSTMRLNFQN